uniref:NADH dehydrogenase subunit 6 n=1 Tax=Schrankia costaestrigalis TaxID=411963 RepID=UPI0024119366|nr:NADH dehydrogenase subunit 6 [Schrankia costaestrigalis]WEH00719.1 NADH dehydrogenase subunit 6 [Schrankia costaestrigalis]
MTKLILSSLIIFISMFMMFLINPLSMGLMILLQTLLICLFSGMLIKTYWFSYILFLTFMGGLLVLFIYVSSIASNELFKPSFYSKMFLLTYMLFIILLQLLLYNNLYWMNFSFNSDMNLFFTNLFFNNENKINLTKLYNNQTFMIMMMLMIYLFITLIMVVKITNIFYGPIRASY